MFLHQNEINNYLMPVDTFFVSSIFEKDQYKKLGYTANKLKVSGWPYQHKGSNKKSIKGFLLIFTGSELINPLSKYSLKKIIYIIDIILNSKKINKVDIKFHPNEDKKILTKTKKIFGKKVRILENIELNKIINDYEFIISDSHTQALLQIINLKKKLIIFDYNNKNLKKYIDNEIFFKTTKKLNNILGNEIDYKTVFTKINKKILNIKPEQSKKNIINYIRKENFNSFKSYKQILDINLWYLLIIGEYIKLFKDSDLDKEFDNFKVKINNFKYYENFLNKTDTRVTKNIVIYFRIKYLIKYSIKIKIRDINIINSADFNYFKFYIISDIFKLIFKLLFTINTKKSKKLCYKFLQLYSGISLNYKFKILIFLIKVLLKFKK